MITVILMTDIDSGVEGIGSLVFKLFNAAGDEVASATSNETTYEFEGSVQAGMTATVERWTHGGDLLEKFDAVVVGTGAAEAEGLAETAAEEAVEEAAPVVGKITPVVK